MVCFTSAVHLPVVTFSSLFIRPLAYLVPLLSSFTFTTCNIPHVSLRQLPLHPCNVIGNLLFLHACSTYHVRPLTIP